MHWFLLLAAGFLEVGWAIGLKSTEGFTKLVPSLLTVAAMVASLSLLGLSLKSLPLGTAYVVWMGIGAVGTAVLGMVLFSEPVSVFRVVCLVLIVAGVTGLKLAHGT